MTAPWWAAFGPAETRVTCEGHRHLIRWADGRLTAASHPDAEGELVMAALGGETARCLEIVQAWGAHDDDLEVLAIGPRSAADEVRTVLPGDDAEAVPPRWVFRASAARYGLWSGPSRPGLFTSTVQARRRRMRIQGIGITPGVVGSRPMISAPLTAVHRRTATYSSGRRFAFGHGSRWQNPAQERAEARLSELRMLFALGPELQWRLSGAVAAAWSDGLARARPGRGAAGADRGAGRAPGPGRAGLAGHRPRPGRGDRARRRGLGRADRHGCRRPARADGRADPRLAGPRLGARAGRGRRRSWSRCRRRSGRGPGS